MINKRFNFGKIAEICEMPHLVELQTKSFDEFLQTVNRGSWRNPIYVEPYDQIDLSVGYDITDNFALSFEAINLTGEYVRWHGRSSKQLWRLEDQGARYAVGARYKF